MRVTTAVIPAAGLGTRFLPATKATPKEMLPVVDKPAIQYVVEEAVAAGLDDILFVTGRSKRPLEDHFDRNVELESFLAERGKSDDLLWFTFFHEAGHILLHGKRDVFSTIEWTTRTSKIHNSDGSVVFEMNDAEIPKEWSQLATDIVYGFLNPKARPS